MDDNNGNLKEIITRKHRRKIQSSLKKYVDENPRVLGRTVFQSSNGSYYGTYLSSLVRAIDEEYEKELVNCGG